MNIDEYSLFNKIILDNFIYNKRIMANELDEIRNCQRHFIECLDLYREDPNSDLLEMYSKKYFKSKFDDLIEYILKEYNLYRSHQSHLYQTKFDKRRLITSLYIMYSLSMYNEKSLVNKFLLMEQPEEEHRVTG